ncbi:MAG: DUF1178 family protein [Pseudomonadota bacterium]
MIRFSLTCAAGHSFDSWFKSNASFDDLRERNLVRCTVCGTTEVRKALMAPQVAQAAAAKPGTEAQPQTMASGPLSTAGSEMERMLAALRRKVEAESTYVGSDFAREARQMHLGETAERQIHGEATPEEAKSLLEDGVPVMPLPIVPKSKAN